MARRPSSYTSKHARMADFLAHVESQEPSNAAQNAARDVLQEWGVHWMSPPTRPDEYAIMPDRAVAACLPAMRVMLAWQRASRALGLDVALSYTHRISRSDREDHHRTRAVVKAFEAEADVRIAKLQTALKALKKARK